jgi:hypothetical protein
MRVTAIEYGLIAAGISVAIIAVVKGFGTKLSALIMFAALYARARRWDADDGTDGTGGAMRAMGWRATALPFQQLR